MQKDAKLKRFVHFSCARVRQTVIDRCKDASASGQSQHVQESPTLPHGLAQSSFSDYSKEWSKYITFASRTGDSIPGRDVDWDLGLVWEYLQFRARTCKPETIKQVLTKLAHFGARHKFVLATSKFDGDAYTYRSVSKMKKQLAIDARKAAKDAGVAYEPVDRCTPVGKQGVSMILSGFALTSEERFNALSRRDRHHVANAVMQHTGGMRFGGFTARNYGLDSFVGDASGSFRLITDYSRYPGMRQFAIEFAASPRFEDMWYNIYAPSGALVDSYPAATLLHWHFRRLQRDGETRVFAPVKGELCSRDDRQA